MQGLKHSHVVTHLDQVAAGGQAGRTRADDSYLGIIAFRDLGNGYVATIAFVVGSKTFEVADSDGRFLQLDRVKTAVLTLYLLGTHTAAYCRQGIGLFQHFGSAHEVTRLDLLDELGYVDPYGAS